MRKTIYTILVLIVLVVAAFLVSPYFLGSNAQKSFHDQIAAFNKTSPLAAYVTITPESYTRHWFSSNAQVKVTVHSPPNLGHASKSYTFDAIIKHGPLFTVSNNGKTSVHWGAGAILLKGNSPDFNGVIVLSTKWGSELDIFADIPNLVFHDQDSNTYTLKNITINTEQTSGNNIKYSLSIPTIDAAIKQGNPQATATFNNLKLVIDGHENDSLWLGTANFSLDKASVGMSENNITVPLGELTNLSTNLETNLTSDKTKVNSSLNLNIESIEAVGKTIKPITFSYSINGIDAAAYRKLKVLGEQIQQQMQQNGQPTAEQGMQAMGAIFDVIQNGMVVKINKIYVGLPKDLASSPLSAEAQLTIKPMNNLMQQIMDAVVNSSQISHTTEAMHDKNNRDQMISGLTGVKPQPHSAMADSQQQMEQQLMQSMPAVMATLTKAVSASGHAMIPQSLVKQLLLENYTKELIHLAANGENVTQTPQELASQAYDYLTNNKMLIPNEDGSMNTQFTFNDGKLLVNGEKPAFNLPEPARTSATPATHNAG